MKNCEKSPPWFRAMGVLTGLLLLASGCQPAPPPQPAKFYSGPTQSMREVVAEINQNNNRIPTLWAQLDYRATLVDKDRGTTNIVSGDGALLYSRPMSLLLRGNKDIAGTVFELGSNDNEFWVKVAADTDTTWWGHYANLGKPCCKPVPIRPDLILQVLGVSVFDTNFLDQPVPVMRFNNDADAYMFVWNVKGMDRWLAQKEIWYDRVTKLPELVLLFDDNGRVILRAYLSKPVPLEVPDTPRENWPKVASEYRLFFPDTGTKLAFEFSNVAISHRGAPRPAAFHRPQPDTKTIVQVDQDCGDGSG